MTRCGIVALAGKPNAGKSTLLNALVGQDLAIISSKPQTTREPVRGLLTEGDTQILFVDPAGLLDPGYPLQSAMVHAARDVIHDADIVLHVHPATDGVAPELETLDPALRVPDSKLILVYTKTDIAERFPIADSRFPILAVSAVKRTGLEPLLGAIRERLPESPFLYDADDVGTQPLRFFAAEFVREAAYAILEQELPYALAVSIEEFRDSTTPVYIRATLAVERDSQKPIVLGKGGKTIKAIGTAARKRLEAFLDQRVHLELWVTVWPKWRKDAAALARIGLPLPPGRAP